MGHSYSRDLRAEQELLNNYVKTKLQADELKEALDAGKRHYAFLSVDVVGSTDIGQGADEWLVQHTFTKYNELLGEILQRHGCWKVSVTPDGVMSAFPSEDEVAATAKELLTSLDGFNTDHSTNPLKSPIRVRCGAHCGDVNIAEEEELSGVKHTVLDVTGHLQKAATSNSLWASKELFEHLYDETGFRRLRRKVDGHAVYEWVLPGDRPRPRRAGKGAGRKAAEKAPERPLRMLVVISAPVMGRGGSEHPAPLDYRAEWQGMTAALRRLPVSVTRLVPPTWSALQDALSGSSYDVVHFIGHGIEDALVLEDELGRVDLVSAPELGRLFAESDVKLSLLNACHSGANMVSPAQSLCKAGVPAVVATTSSIRDDAACRLSERLYARLALEETVTLALEKAKEAVQREYGAKWAERFTLVGDAAIRLIEGADQEGELAIFDPAPPHNLRHTASFFGRREELVSLAELFADSSTRLILTTGVGGIGKSVLAWEAAYRNRFRFDAIVLSEAKDRPTYGLPELLSDLEGVAKIGLGMVADEGERIELALHFMKQRRYLIIVDNAETIGKEAWPGVTSFFNRIDPMMGNKVLITIRPLRKELERMDGSAHLPVGRLDWESSRRLLLKEAFRRSRNILEALQRDRSLTDEVVMRTGHHPKMLELFVGQAIRKSLHEAVEAVRGLTGDLAADAEEMVGGSVEGVSPDAEKVLGAFSAVVGSAMGEAIAEICADGEEVGRALDELWEASLVERDPELRRYSMHQVVSDYVRKKKLVSEDEMQEYRRRASQHYLKAARQLHAMMTGETWGLASVCLRLELGNVQAGFEWSIENNDWEQVLSYAYPLGRALMILGLWADRILVHEAAIEASQKLRKRDDEGRHLGNLGLAYAALGQVEKAIEFHELALAISREIGDRRGEGSHLGNLGLAYADLGQVQKAIGYHELGLAIAREIGDRRGEGNRLGNLGLAYADLGQVEKAIGYHELGLAIARDIGDRRGEGNHLGNLGSAYAGLKNYRAALACFLIGAAILEEVKSPDAELVARNILVLKEELGEKEFHRLIKEVQPRAQEIVESLLSHPKS